MYFRCGVGGIGGFEIIVTTDDPELYGATITISLSGETVGTTTFDNTGNASYSVEDPGTYTVSVTYEGQSYTQTVAVSPYSTVLNLWTATINLTTTSTELYGATVTVESTEIATTTVTFDNNGAATYKAHKPGSYTFSVTYGGQTYSTTVAVSAETTYNAILNTWNAVIDLSTSSPELYGLDIVITKNSETIGTVQFSAQGAATYTVHESGTYSFTCTYDGEDFTESLTISAEGTYSVTIDTTPDGATVTPVNDIQTWLKCAKIRNKSYTTIAQVLADATTVTALIASSNAVDYMVRSTNWASSVVADSSAMTKIGANNYCANTLLANSTWCEAICNSEYFESVLTTKVPTMTGLTTPSGEVISNKSPMDSYDYRAFNNAGDAMFMYCDWYGYKFTKPVKVYIVHAIEPNSSNFSYTAFILRKGIVQVSTDGNTYEDVHEFDHTATQGSGTEITMKFTNDKPAGMYWRILVMHTSVNYVTGKYLQFYGRASLE